MSPIHAPSQLFIQHLSQHDSGLPPPSLSLRTPPRAECPPTRPDIHQSPSVGRAEHELHPLHAPPPPPPVTAPPEALPTLASAFLLQL